MNTEDIRGRVDDALTHQSLDAENYAEKAWAVVPDAARLLAAIEAVNGALDDWEAAIPFPDAEKSQQWYSLGKRHAAERIRFEITEALK